MLKGKNAIITGARRGIGRATVETFASFGANVWACARKPDGSFEADMQQVAEKYNVSIWPVYFDVTDETQIKQAVQAIRKQKVSIDALVNMAGIVEDSTSFQMTSIDKMKHLFDTNFFAVTLLTQYISRLMARQNSGRHPGPGGGNRGLHRPGAPLRPRGRIYQEPLCGRQGLRRGAARRDEGRQGKEPVPPPQGDRLLRLLRGDRPRNGLAPRRRPRHPGPGHRAYRS